VYMRQKQYSVNNFINTYSATFLGFTKTTIRFTTSNTTITEYRTISNSSIDARVLVVLHHFEIVKFCDGSNAK
jgi:hypothetical protein